MPGAGSLIAANHIYKVAKPDGRTIGHFIGGVFLGQILGQKGIEFCRDLLPRAPRLFAPFHALSLPVEWPWSCHHSTHGGRR